ncbi:MAG: hypothetical protein M3237_22635 [Actinomycetota bacterium]|nr:hypothetical protein [Actinomycetota bacterium]
MIAWVVVQPLGGFADDYPFYAPLGAVVATSMTVASSLRATGRTCLALALGALLALAALSVSLPQVVALALVVAVGTWVSGWSKVAPVATWVPISGLFVLILGQDDPEHYVAAYLGLTTLGAVIGTGVNLLLPSLPLLSAKAVQDSLRSTLAEQLDELADGLTQEPPPTKDEWRARRREIDPRANQMSQAVGLALDAQRVNWRAKFWRDAADRQYRQARALEQLAFFVAEITGLIIEGENAHLDDLALGRALRPAAAEVLETAAEMLRSVDRLAVAGQREWRRAQEANERLAQAVRCRRDETDAEFFMAGSLVTAVRRTLAELEPAART